jgi:hypothetical protein
MACAGPCTEHTRTAGTPFAPRPAEAAVERTGGRPGRRTTRLPGSVRSSSSMRCPRAIPRRGVPAMTRTARAQPRRAQLDHTGVDARGKIQTCDTTFRTGQPHEPSWTSPPRNTRNSRCSRLVTRRLSAAQRSAVCGPHVDPRRQVRQQDASRSIQRRAHLGRFCSTTTSRPDVNPRWRTAAQRALASFPYPLRRGQRPASRPWVDHVSGRDLWTEEVPMPHPNDHTERVRRRTAGPD